MPGYPSATGRLDEQSAVRSLDLDDVRLTYAVDGAMGLLPGGFFPGIPAAHWADHPLDAHGRVVMSAGGLLVERDGRSLLVDAGLGPYSGPMGIGEPPFGIAESGDLPKTLATLGYAPEDVTAVAFTHLHADHTGWAIAPGTRRKFFPRADYLVAAAEWAPHGCGETIPGAPSREEVIEPLAEAFTEIADGDEIFPGVTALVTPGHSPGHTSYVVSTEAGRLIAFGDAFHIPGQLAHPDWPSIPDVDAEAVVAARTRLVDELARPGTIGFGCHFGDQAFGRVVRDGNGVARWEPVPAVPLLPSPRQLGA